LRDVGALIADGNRALPGDGIRIRGDAIGDRAVALSVFA
jgi:hypothetical protein